EILLLATSASTTARARLTASRASGSRRTGRRSSMCATSRTASSVRSFPLMCRAFKSSSQFSVLSSQLFEGASLWRYRQFSKSNAPLGAADRGAKHLQIFLRQRAGFHLRIGDDVRGFAFGQQLAVLSPSQFVSEADHFLPDMLQVRAHNDFVIIMHGSLVAALGIDYGDEAAVFTLHIFVAEAELAQEFYPSHLKPDEVIGVIDDAHLVGLGIADADASFIHGRCRLLGHIDGHRCMRPVHRPVHFGLRISRNDSIPSRKSALSRMAAFSRTAASICKS